MITALNEEYRLALKRLPLPKKQYKHCRLPMSSLSQ